MGTILAVLGAAPALAEGARFEMRCDVVTRCEAGGACDATSAEARFVVEPESIDRDEIGLFSLWVDDSAAHEARGVSRVGPFYWQDGDGTRMTLTLSGPTSAVWVRHGDGRDSEIDLMTCEVIF